MKVSPVCASCGDKLSWRANAPSVAKRRNYRPARCKKCYLASGDWRGTKPRGKTIRQAVLDAGGINAFFGKYARV